MNIYFLIDEKVDKGATRRGVFSQDYGGAFVIKKIPGKREGFLVTFTKAPAEAEGEKGGQKGWPEKVA